MIDFTNRVPQEPNKFKIIKADGSSEIITLERADNPTTVGTPLNRDNFMKMQGMIGSTTSPKETIIQVFANGDTLKTEFIGSNIVETFTGGTSGLVIKKKISFAENGDIIEVIE